MKNTLKLLLFMVFMGSITAGLIIGMDALTADRIAENAAYEWKSSMLDHNNHAATVNNYNDLFDENFTALNEHEDEREIVYIHNTLNTINYSFKGGGVWGDIDGIVTLESDLVTIVKITVLNQDETPGLGGVVATREYLDNYVGKKMLPELSLVVPDGSLDPENQVDQITGATGTSTRFIIMLNAVYQKKVITLDDVLNQGQEEEKIYQWKSTMLAHNNIAANRDNYKTLFDDNFTKLTDLVDERENVYLLNDSNTYNYFFEGEGRNGMITGIVTLDSNKETIIKITVLENVETQGLGSIVATREYLDKFVGKKMLPELSLTIKDGLTEDNQVDQIASATETSNAFILMLNTTYNTKIGGLE